VDCGKHRIIDEQLLRILIEGLCYRYEAVVEEQENCDLLIGSVPVPQDTTDYR
jgi:hypothetical protein